MAYIQSAQSGNFSATSTWSGGVVPANRDGFQINAGHTVTVDASTPVHTNGFEDSNIFGILQHTSSGTSTIRMNGRLHVRGGGTYHMRGDAICEFTGTNADNHGLWVYNEAAAAFIAEGEDGMPSTTTTSAHAENSYGFSVASSTGFAAGEWISIFNNSYGSTADEAYYGTMRDEGFWIHDISGNTIFIRQFVFPDATIASNAVAGTNIVRVSNAKVFRVGQRVIFGTGTNRNTELITAIDYATNTLTFDTTTTGTIANLPVYLSGTEKFHDSGEKIRKVATVTTAQSNSGTSTITVADATRFAAGDEIWIEARSEVGGSTDFGWNAYDTMRTVSSVSGNVITLSATLPYTVVSGALVTRLTRRIKIRGVTDSDHAFFHTDYYVGTGDYNTIANFNKKIVIKDVQFRRVGNSVDGNARGVSFRGWCSSNSLPVTISQTIGNHQRNGWFEGFTVNGTLAVIDIGGVFSWDCRYVKLRNCFCANTWNGFNAPWYQPGQAVYNCISTRNQSTNYRSEGLHELGEFAYNYSSRADNHMRWLHPYEYGLGYHDFIADAGAYGVSHFNSQQAALGGYKFKFTGLRYGHNFETIVNSIYYSSSRYLSGLINPQLGTAQAGPGLRQQDRGNLGYSSFTIFEDNFEYDAVRQYATGCERFWDNTENAWRVLFRYDYNEYGYAFTETILVPAGATLRISANIKLATGWSGSNYPTLEARDLQLAISPNQLSNSGGQWSTRLAGGQTSIAFTAASVSNYEERRITINPVNFARNIQVGITAGSNTDTAEGFWMKNIELYLDRTYPNSAFDVANCGSQPRLNYSIRSVFGALITRIGGRFI
jgi:hypothetical protein